MSAVAFDIVVLLVFAIFGFYGWVTGFIPSLGAVCGAIIGIIICLLYTSDAADE